MSPDRFPNRAGRFATRVGPNAPRVPANGLADVGDRALALACGTLGHGGQSTWPGFGPATELEQHAPPWFDVSGQGRLPSMTDAAVRGVA
jgi:hypothetical protein